MDDIVAVTVLYCLKQLIDIVPNLVKLDTIGILLKDLQEILLQVFKN